jgi:hypothetical protein
MLFVLLVHISHATSPPTLTCVQATRALGGTALNLGGLLPAMTHARAAGTLDTQVSGSSKHRSAHHL